MTSPAVRELPIDRPKQILIDHRAWHASKAASGKKADL